MAKFLIRGKPGSGKTTLIKNLAHRINFFLPQEKIYGFYTEEIREKGIRVGFKISTFEGKEDIMAHIDFPTPYRVSRYKFDKERFERVALPELERAKRRSGLIIIDEIGKMELFSERFRSEIRDLFASDKTIIATIPISPIPFISHLTKTPETKVIEITLSNRDRILEDLIKSIKSLL